MAYDKIITLHGRMDHCLEYVLNEEKTGFANALTRYLYFLSGRSKARQNTPVPFAVRKEVTKLQRYSRQFRFLLQYRIDTDKQLTMLGEALQGQIDLLADYRKELYIQRRTGRDVDVSSG